MKLQAPPVKRIALAHDIPVFQPVTLKDGTALEEIRQLSPELIVVAAYGRLLPWKFWSCRPRGASMCTPPCSPSTGGCPHQLGGAQRGGGDRCHHHVYGPGAGCGDIIAQASTPIDPEETVESVHDRLAGLGARLLVQTVSRLEAGTAERTPRTGNGPPMRPCFPGSSLPLTGPARPVRSTTRSGG